MKDNLPPEEKLLNLIKGRKKTSPPSPHLQDSQNKPPAPASTKPDIKYSTKSFIDTYFTFPYIHKLIMVLTGISFIYLVAALAYPFFGLKEIKLPETPDKRRIADSELEIGKKTKPYEFYLQGIQGRQIFSGNLAQEDTGMSPPADLDLIKYINLVGIVSGENPQAIIEDKKIQKTYYLTKGQFIGEMQVQDIKEGLVILNYKGQKYELYL